MNITITHTIDPNILGLLQAFIGNMGGQTTTTPKANGKAAKQIEPSKDVPPAQEPASTAPQAKAVGLSEVRALVQTKSADGKRDNVKALLADFGVPNVSSLKADQCAAFYTQLENL